MASTLIIGIGTTGKNIIEEAQQFHYDFTGLNKPVGNYVEYMFLETNLKESIRNTAEGRTQIEPVWLSLQNNEATINLLKNKIIDNNWIPEPRIVLNNEDGAGGMPSYGRLALWGEKNYNMVINAIRTKYQDIGGDEKTNIFIVGTLTGGTGSGICVDLAYLVHKLTGNTNIFGMLLLPANETFTEKESYVENAYCALMSLDHYSKNDYDVKWPSDSIKQIRFPFKSIQFLSQDFVGAKASITKQELFSVAGMILSLNILNADNKDVNFQNLIQKRRIDDPYAGKYTTPGFKMIYYPKSQIEEVISLDIIGNLLEKAIDEIYFVDSNKNTKEIDTEKSEISRKSKKLFENIINDSFDRMNASSGPDGLILPRNIESNVNVIMKKNHGKSSDEKYIFDLFSTKNKLNYFQILNNNLSLMKDSFIERIDMIIADAYSDYSNLPIAQLTLESIIEYIPNITRFYQDKYKVTGKDEDWDNLLSKHVGETLANTTSYKYIGQKKEYLIFQLNSILQLNKIHHSISILTELEISLRKSESPIRDSSRKIELPSIAKLEEIKLNIREVLASEDSNKKNSLATRRKEIVTTLSKKSDCFCRLYSKDTLDSEISYGLKQYHQKPQIDLETILGTNKIWEYFKNFDINDLYQISLRNTLQKVRSSKLIDDFNFFDIINNIIQVSTQDEEVIRVKEIFSRDEETIKQQIPPMVKVRPGKDIFSRDPDAMLVVLTQNHKNLASIMNSYKLDLTKSNTLDIPALKNAVVFYQEYTKMGDGAPFNPLSNIDYMEKAKGLVKKGLKENKSYKSEKLPYFSSEQVNEYFQLRPTTKEVK